MIKSMDNRNYSASYGGRKKSSLIPTLLPPGIVIYTSLVGKVVVQESWSC